MATFMTPRAKSIPQISADGRMSAVTPAAATAPAAQAVEKSGHAQWRYICAAYALVIGGGFLGWFLDHHSHPPVPIAVQGLGVFAALYVAAQAIERAVEPLTEWTGTALGGVRTPTEGQAGGEDPAAEPESARMTSKAELKYRRALAIKTARAAAIAPRPADDDPGGGPGGAVGDTAGKAAEIAAKCQAAVEQARRNSAVLVWGIATFLGIVVSAWAGLALLRSVGVQGGPRALDIIVTGLAIGGGSKPLHDLISNLQAAKVDKKDPAEVKTA